ncbi:MAG: hypothetical protein KIH65_000470 [Candidatus Uhrbacteria bacterium]|nr:hypothetical protein [Candidatus Uhrbacteria bacterium]
MKYGLSTFQQLVGGIVRKPICTIALSLLLFTTDAAYAKPPACTSECVRVTFDIEAKNPQGGGTEIVIWTAEGEEYASRQCPTFHTGSACILKGYSTGVFSQGEEITIQSNHMFKPDSWKVWDWVRSPIVTRRIKMDAGTWSLDQEGLKTKVTVTRI